MVLLQYSCIKWGIKMFEIFAIIVFIILLFDLSKIRNQHDQIIEQNEEIIELLKELRDK